MVLDPVRSGLIGKLKKRRLQVQLPVTLDKATLRDGLDASPPASRKIGERAWWLVQMVSIAPPSHWTQRFTCDVETFIEAVEDTEYGSDLMSALTEAAIRHVDDVWLAALCRHFVSKNPSAEAADALDTTILKIVRAAPIASRATLLAQTLHSIDESRFGLAHVLLSGSDCDWSTDTTRAAFALLEKRIRGDSQQWAHARNTLTEWGRHANVEIALAEIERLHAKCPDKSPWRNAIEAVREIIEFRAAMRQELLT
jgi:hypothetical protein